MKINLEVEFIKFKVMKHFKQVLFFFCLLLSSFAVEAQDFVYKPNNPAFGGDTFNYQWMLNSAQAQNLIENPETNDPFNQGSTLDDFTESLNRQLLSQLSRELINNELGTNGLTDGSYTIGNFQINVETTLDGVGITIYDNAIGEQTQIIIPFF